MSANILQINFNFSSSRAEYEAASEPGAAFIAGVPGLGWKIWLMNEVLAEAGGIYLFHDEAAAQGFAAQVEAMLKNDPRFSSISIKQFGVIESLTTVTRGPIAPAHVETFGQLAAEALATVPSLTPVGA